MALTILGTRTSSPTRQLESFPAPQGISGVKFHTDEFTSLCPVTGQPDFCSVTIEYIPGALCLESKSLKLYLWSFRERGAFTEAIACEIADDIVAAISPQSLTVTVFQQPRGGISLEAKSSR